MKLLRIIVLYCIFFGLLSCNLFLGLPTGEKFEYLGEKPERIFIDESDNGIVVFKNRICKIKNLSITNENVDLKDYDNRFPIGNVAYSVDKNGNGILIYSRDSKAELIYDTVLKNYSEKAYYFLNIKNNNFIVDSVQNIFYFSDTDIKIINFKNLNRIIYFLNKNNSLIFNYIENNKITKGNQIDNDLKEAISNLKIDIDEKGNGSYSYNDLTTFKSFSINEFKKGEEKISLKFRDETDTKNNYTLQYLRHF